MSAAEQSWGRQKKKRPPGHHPRRHRHRTGPHQRPAPPMVAGAMACGLPDSGRGSGAVRWMRFGCWPGSAASIALRKLNSSPTTTAVQLIGGHHDGRSDR
jgi:hypothetical protein